MAEFAKLDDNNKVVDIVVVNDDVITVEGIQKEQIGINFLTQITNYNKWVQTFKNGFKRKNYASIDGFYDSIKDVFIAKQPFPSWTLNNQTYQWEAPIPIPDDYQEIYYIWNENLKKWQPQIVPSIDNI